MRRILAAVSAAALVAGLGVAIAAPARAATVSVTVDCVVDGPFTAAEPMMLTVHQGDTIVVNDTVAHRCDEAGTDSTIALSTFASWPGFPVLSDDGARGDAPYIWVVSDSAPLGPTARAVMAIANARHLRTTDTEVFFALTILPKVNDVLSDAPYWHQATGRHNATDPCLEGWNRGWEMWMNEGKGGFVCVRDIPAYGNQ